MARINGGNGEAVVIRGRFFSMSNIRAIGSGRKSGNTANGISLNDAAHATVKRVVIEGFQKSGLELYNCEHIRILNVYTHNNGSRV